MTIQVDLEICNRPHMRPAADLVSLLKGFHAKNRITVGFYNHEGNQINSEEIICPVKEYFDNQEYIFGSYYFWAMVLKEFTEEDTQEIYKGLRLTIDGKDEAKIKKKLEVFYLFNKDVPVIYGTSKDEAGEAFTRSTKAHQEVIKQKS